MHERTTPHTIFSLEEILSIIFCCYGACTDSSGRPAVDKGTLASLARTCRSFHAPALDVLYSHTDMACLVQTMSSDLWYRDRMTLYFHRPMDPQDWNNFYHYSRRVRILQTWSGFGISKGIYQTLSHPPNNISKIFPKLVGLRVQNTVDHEFISLLVTRNLTSILLSFDEGDDVATNILPSLPSTCPHLRRIKLSGSMRLKVKKTIHATSAYEVLCKIPFLETILCSEVVMSAKILSHIACLSSLKEVDLTLPVYPLEEIESNRNTFPALQKLILSSSTPRSCLQLLESVTSPSLETIHIRASSMFSEEVSRKIYAVLSPFKSLTHITILQYPSGDPPRGYGVYPDLLNPLLNLHNLQHLRMCSESMYSVDDEVLGQMASAWPRLEVLDLWQPKEWPAVPRTTLPGIIPLLRCCPKLHFLGMVFDATQPIADLSTYDTCNSDISLDLDVGISPIADPPLVAAFLSFATPNLRSLIVADTFGMNSILEEDGTKWGQVKQIIGVKTDTRRYSTNPIMLNLQRTLGMLSSLD
ncbi:hypothetical protein BJ138DRAFT_858802, partial [Hygrophoropsis aurantiaca]